MRNSGGRRLPIFLLLLACASATTCSARVAAPPPPEPVVHPHGVAVPTDLLDFYRPIFADAKIQECWRSLLGTESCITSIFQSVLGGRLQLSAACCEAVRGLGDHCLPKMFSLPAPFGNLIPAVISGVCAAPAPPV
ncbi:hypothetical protein Taro_006167 [Colocasia esculenta]|uniref:Prolamin-like domain-containing protein n=1 Tax=Colocasia esculenta TaxID=4460 RepID=A0A843TN12_COLES|nr:hypothetical protein [Colocasia esculenta]